MTYAKVIADSISPEGVRLTTFEVRFHRFVLAEFNTHRVFSRNSASSRAIPFEKQVAKIREDLALPVEWATEQKGMQGGPPLTGHSAEVAQILWEDAADNAIAMAESLRAVVGFDGEGGQTEAQKVHKSIVNRLLEPFMQHTVVVTATAWENFFAQRCSPLAQPEIRVAAEMMREAYEASTPQPLRGGQWHLPYVEFGFDDYDVANHLDPTEVADPDEVLRALVKVSAARCARVSYLTHDGKRDTAADIDLYEKLVSAKPAHWSPLEHVATPWAEKRQGQHALDFYTMDGVVHYVSTSHLPKVGNLLGWRSLRTEVEAQQGEVTFR